MAKIPFINVTDAEWSVDAAVGEPAAMEAAMLDFASDVQSNARVSRRIRVNLERGRLVVRIPARQS